MSLETNARDEIVRFAASIYERSLTFGASGNISVRIEDGWLMTPTGSTMGNLDPARLSSFDSRACLLYTSPSPRDATLSRMPSSA